MQRISNKSSAIKNGTPFVEGGLENSGHAFKMCILLDPGICGFWSMGLTVCLSFCLSVTIWESILNSCNVLVFSSISWTLIEPCILVKKLNSYIWYVKHPYMVTFVAFYRRTWWSSLCLYSYKSYVQLVMREEGTCNYVGPCCFQSWPLILLQAVMICFTKVHLSVGCWSSYFEIVF